jgi:hypothetical protein
MAARNGRLDFPGASVWVSYGTPTEMDDVGCDGIYIEKVEVTDAQLYMLYLDWCKIWKFECYLN